MECKCNEDFKAAGLEPLEEINTHLSGCWEAKKQYVRMIHRENLRMQSLIDMIKE